MVGTARFELTTSCSRSRRATRLRYVPCASILRQRGWERQVVLGWRRLHRRLPNQAQSLKAAPPGRDHLTRRIKSAAGGIGAPSCTRQGWERQVVLGWRRLHRRLPNQAQSLKAAPPGRDHLTRLTNSTAGGIGAPSCTRQGWERQVVLGWRRLHRRLPNQAQSLKAAPAETATISPTIQKAPKPILPTPPSQSTKN